MPKSGRLDIFVLSSSRYAQADASVSADACLPPAIIIDEELSLASDLGSGNDALC